MTKTDVAAHEEFQQVLARLRAGDSAAETLVFRRYIHRLIGLATTQFDAWLRDRADPESVVLSAYQCFFRRHAEGKFDLAGWDDLWAILALITLRKCAKRRRYLRAGRRDVRREVGWADAAGQLTRLAERSQTPDETAAMDETIEFLYAALKPAERPVIELILMGCNSREIAGQVDVSRRTVERVRQRARQHLKRYWRARSLA